VRSPAGRLPSSTPSVLSWRVPLPAALKHRDSTTAPPYRQDNCAFDMKLGGDSVRSLVLTEVLWFVVPGCLQTYERPV